MMSVYATLLLLNVCIAWLMLSTGTKSDLNSPSGTHPCTSCVCASFTHTAESCAVAVVSVCISATTTRSPRRSVAVRSFSGRNTSLTESAVTSRLMPVV